MGKDRLSIRVSVSVCAKKRFSYQKSQSSCYLTYRLLSIVQVFLIVRFTVLLRLLRHKSRQQPSSLLEPALLASLHSLAPTWPRRRTRRQRLRLRPLLRQQAASTPRSSLSVRPNPLLLHRGTPLQLKFLIALSGRLLWPDLSHRGQQ